MLEVEGNVVVIKPKKPYLDWIISQPDPPEELRLEELQNDCTAFLIPEFADYDSARKYVLSHYAKIFELELEAWYADENLWPSGRSQRMFEEWFNVEVHSVVYGLFGENGSNMEDMQ
ncbi:MAG: hypothetical protein OEY67_10085 [Gammaproteobacteria bacterium]|nr:hypothetical protein [Gammaproteobacteria bacterium]